jgi:hypothetical protein
MYERPLCCNLLLAACCGAALLHVRIIGVGGFDYFVRARQTKKPSQAPMLH